MLLRLSLLLLTAGLTAANAQQCSEPFEVGYRIVDLREGRRAAIWYPTSKPGEDQAYAEDGIRGRFSRDAAPLDCDLPLVVFSHGLGGCGVQSLFLTEELARAGFIVIAPDHRDAACSVDGEGSPSLQAPQESLLEPDTWTPSTYIDRREDITRSIDAALSQDEVGPTIDPERIGVIGHSLGGYAALGVAGAWREWRDDRVKAVVLLSPYVHPFQAKKTLSQVEVPVMLQGADFDIFITPMLEGPEGAYEALPSPRFFAKLRGGSHFEWTNLVCLGVSSIAACLETRENARLINEYTIDFLRRYLRQEASARLVGSGERLRAYERAVRLAGVSAASFDDRVGAAPDSIVSVFGEGLAASVASAQTLPLPTRLGGVQLLITDARGNTLESPMFFAGPGQLNILAPGRLAPGRALAQVRRNGKTIGEGPIAVNRVAPAVFSARATGNGVAAATFLRIAADGSRSTGLVFNPQNGEATPLDVNRNGESLYVSVFGTGLRAAQGEVTATVGGVGVDVAGPVPHPEFAGLDQLNLGPLPGSLAGRGLVDIRLSAGAIAGNATQLRIQ